MSSKLRGFLQSPITCSISSPDILLNNLRVLSDALSLCSSFIVRDHLIHLDCKLGDKLILDREVAHIPPS